MERIGVLGLGRSGRAAAQLALERGYQVFASELRDGAVERAAVEAVRAAGGEAESGGHSEDRLAECDLLVVSPGIPPTADVLRSTALAGVPRISELEFAYRHLGARLIAVTGTNGKTTTTALAAHLLQAADIDVLAAGNIGLALSEVAAREDQPAWVVVEASSYQLADIERFRADIGVFTNLTADHMDRYRDMDAYRADKARLFENATVDSVGVLNGEDREVLSRAADAPGRRLLFHVGSPLPDEAEGGFVEHDRLVLRTGGDERRLVATSELRLMGRHNQANVLAAVLAASVVAPDASALADGLRSFAPPVHRLEPVVERDGVLWINDSKATNVASTRVALEAMDRPVVLLLGGKDKGGSYAFLADVLDRVRTVLAYGEARDRIARELRETVPVEVLSGDFEAVVGRARAVAESGDVVLLSPACSSFDMFRDYEERGERFRALVQGPVVGGGDG